ncbi:hypothetical protein ACF06M_30560 [Streptomyces sp. NPDC015238]|uniref:hypothetical protein n=1 Tax=unclassified Streptomyces TaxID=2593676 RepID=UPI0036FA4BFE
MAPLLLAGALLGALSGCTSGEGATGGGAAGGASGGSSAGGGAGEAAGPPPSVKLAAPAAFDAARGWEVKAGWLPQGQPLPFAVSPRAGAVAYLDKGPKGYVLTVREAASGRVLATGRPWQGPELTEEQAREDSAVLAVPRIAVVAGRDRDYFAVWARGRARKDALHEYREVVAAAFYPADATGRDLAPAGAGNAQAPDGEFDRPLVLPGPGGLLVTSYGGDHLLIAPDGRVTDRGGREVVLNGASAAPDHLQSFQGAKGLVTNGDDVLGHDGGFGAEGGWQSTRVAPAGVEAVRTEDKVGGGTSKVLNGRIVGAAGGQLLAEWVTDGDNVSAVHDLATGAVRATAPCPPQETDYGIGIPDPRNRAEVPPAVSPGERFLVKAGTVFDLRTGKGTCTDGGADARKITLATVGDDGVAYGTAGEEPPLTPVSVSVTTGAVTALPETTVTPDAMTGRAGVFVTYAGTDTVRLIVLPLKG